MLKPGGRLVLLDSLQRGDQPDYEGLLELFPQNYHEPYYHELHQRRISARSRAACGLTHVRDVQAFVSKVMVFDKPAASPVNFTLARTIHSDGRVGIKPRAQRR